MQPHVTKHNTVIGLLWFAIKDVFGSIVAFPFWWFTGGMIIAIRVWWKSIVDQYQSLALGVWIKNIFVPMFGQYDWEGRLISFFVRIIQIIFRSLILVVWVCIVTIVLLIWFCAPLYVVYQLVRHGQWYFNQEL